MGNKKIWIGVGIAVLLLILIMWYISSRNKKLAAQAELDRQQQQYLTNTLPGTASGAGGNLSTTLNSLEGVIDSLSGLFNKNNTTNLQQQYFAQCSLAYTNPAQIEACVAQKMMA